MPSLTTWRELSARSNSAERSHQVTAEPSTPISRPTAHSVATSLATRTRSFGWYALRTFPVVEPPELMH